MSVPDSRVDYAIIADFVPQGARVLDVGCGDGTLLALLEEKSKSMAVVWNSPRMG